MIAKPRPPAAQSPISTASRRRLKYWKTKEDWPNDYDDDVDDDGGDDNDVDDDKKHLANHERGSVNNTANTDAQQKTIAEEHLLEPEIK